MDESKNPPVFPWCGDLNQTPFINLGMRMRDWFATHASEEDIKVQQAATIGLTRAQARYAHADSMLRAREST